VEIAHTPSTGGTTYDAKRGVSTYPDTSEIADDGLYLFELGLDGCLLVLKHAQIDTYTHLLHIRQHRQHRHLHLPQCML
jgi:hypothetical protein